MKTLRARDESKLITVAFLVSENAKWSCQSLYDVLEKNDKFEPIVLVTADGQRCRNTHDLISQLNETHEFFRSRNMNVRLAYDVEEQRYLDLREFHPDIVFYQQPWAIDPLQSLSAVSKFALGCYVPYSIAGTTVAVASYPKTFLYGVWRHFVVSESIRDEYLSWMVANKESLIVTGHPKLDSYDQHISNEEHYIIYAPHFALNNSLLKLSTFDWSGRYLLDFARCHRNLNWVFKPHPRLKLQVIEDGLMSEAELNAYYDEWREVGMVYDQGDYFGIFKNSDALITDCSSFLSEFLPTKMPVIHLISKDMVPLNPISRVTSSHYYKAHDLKELEFYLNDVIVNKNDPLREERINDIGILASDGIPASSRIVDHLTRELQMHDE